MSVLKKAVVAPLLLLALVTSLQTAVPAGAMPGGNDRVSHSEATTDQLTLLTGDTVIFDGPASIAVQPGPGRQSTSFLTEQIGEEHYVIPSDALPLLANGTLDKRLFNVTMLQDLNYGAELPLIITRPRGPAPLSEPFLQAADLEVTQQLNSVGMLAAQVGQANRAGLWRFLTDGVAPGTSVALDGLLQPALEDSVHQIGAPAAWEADLDGAGVAVAVLDTGVDHSHPDLIDRVVSSKNFTDEADEDAVGHGTHVASILAGTGALDDRYRGVAPAADVLSAKVCHADGCPESAILAGMQWAAEQGATVVNMSLGGPQRPGADPLADAVDRLTAEHGVLFVAAAGNDGGEATVNSPATADAALAVGAVDRQDSLAGFSSQGPRADGGLKPDLSAPGVGIVAAAPDEGYVAANGTSMAAPHVSGAAALLAQQHPHYSPAQLKAVLMGSAEAQLQLPVVGQGAGRLDLARSIAQDLTTSPPSVSFARQEVSKADPDTVTVTYRNHGEVNQQLQLSLVTEAPAGMFSVDAEQLTVPGGGTAKVSLTVEPSADGDSGYFGGHLIAESADGNQQVTTPVGIEVEPESYDVTLVHRDRDGAPTTNYRTILRGPLDDTDATEVIGRERGGDGAAEVTLRLPAGDYVMVGWLTGATAHNEEQWITLVNPTLTVTSDTTVELDARAAEPVEVHAQGRSLQPISMSAMARYRTDQGWAWNANTFSFVQDGLYLGHIGDDSPVDNFTAGLQGSWAAPGADGRVESATEIYHVGDVRQGSFFTGFSADLRPAEMATVRNDYAVQHTGSQLTKADGFVHQEPFVAPSNAYVAFDGPAVRTEHYTTGEHLEWQSRVIEQLPTGADTFEQLVQLTTDPVTRATAGALEHHRWNYGVFGPSLHSESAGVHRDGDDLIITPTFFDDIDGNQAATAAIGSIVVSRNGQEIAQRPYLPGISPRVNVPADSGEYEVEVSLQRPGSAPLSTHIDLSWTFESQHAAQRLRLPTPVVRLTPDTDGINNVADRRPWHLSVDVEAPPDASPAPVAQVTVDVSFDDGENWQQVPVRPGVSDGAAMVTPPAGQGYVSLRANASDRDGNSVEQTILRAYRFGH